MDRGIVLILIPFVAVVIASVSETTKKGDPFPRNLTLVGWLLIVLAGASSALQYWDNREKATATAIRESLGLRQLEMAIYALMYPHVVRSDPPEMKDRFRVVAAYGEAGVIKGICNIKIAEEVGKNSFDPEASTSTWGAYITDKTNDGLTQLRSTQAAYGQIFEDKINMLIGRIISHPWNEFLLAAKRRVPHATRGLLCLDRPPQIRRAYEDLSESYWKLLRDLEKEIGTRHCILRGTLGIKDQPPLFLRSLAGYFFVPDPKDTDPIMDQVCRDVVKL